MAPALKPPLSPSLTGKQGDVLEDSQYMVRGDAQVLT